MFRCLIITTPVSLNLYALKRISLLLLLSLHSINMTVPVGVTERHLSVLSFVGLLMYKYDVTIILPISLSWTLQKRNCGSGGRGVSDEHGTIFGGKWLRFGVYALFSFDILNEGHIF